MVIQFLAICPVIACPTGDLVLGRARFGSDHEPPLTTFQSQFTTSPGLVNPRLPFCTRPSCNAQIFMHLSCNNHRSLECAMLMSEWDVWASSVNNSAAQNILVSDGSVVLCNLLHSKHDCYHDNDISGSRVFVSLVHIGGARVPYRLSVFVLFRLITVFHLRNSLQHR